MVNDIMPIKTKMDTNRDITTNWNTLRDIFKQYGEKYVKGELWEAPLAPAGGNEEYTPMQSDVADLSGANWTEVLSFTGL